MNQAKKWLVAKERFKVGKARSNFCFQYNEFGLDYADVNPNYKKRIVRENP
ncbi:hypothetical protein [Vibrio pomeroyi]|uniref:hypothetical protein n=1 Tax=Vibrio pomeroyi TaxID=198832 RepID=UPI0035A65A8D